jgi:hypothetical protein
MAVSGIGGFKYFFILVDDISGYITIFLIQAKSQALQHYKTFCEQGSNQLYKRVTQLRCDNTMEFLTKEFATYLNTQGTVLQQIPDYTPELNGTAECNPKTLMNMGCTIPQNAQLPKNLWAEAVVAAAFIKNLYNSTKKPTPLELWYGFKPGVSILTVYGCKVYNSQ